MKEEEKKERRFVKRAVCLSLAAAVLLTVAGVFVLTHRAELLAAHAERCAWKDDIPGMKSTLEKLSALAESDPEKTEAWHAAMLSCADVLGYRERYDDAAALLEEAQEDELDEDCAAKAADSLGRIRYEKALALFRAGDYAGASRAAFEDRDYEPARVLYELAEAALATPTPEPTPEPTPMSAETPEPTIFPTEAPLSVNNPASGLTSEEKTTPEEDEVPDLEQAAGTQPDESSGFEPETGLESEISSTSLEKEAFETEDSSTLVPETAAEEDDSSTQEPETPPEEDDAPAPAPETAPDQDETSTSLPEKENNRDNNSTSAKNNSETEDNFTTESDESPRAFNFTFNLNINFGGGSAAVETDSPAPSDTPGSMPAAAPTPKPAAAPAAEAAAVRTPRPAGMMSAGFSHTVVLRDDGTVFAAGDGAMGQTDVSGWTDVVSVSAGARHTLGLRRDGSVVSCGDDTSGQCDVSMFTGVSALAAGYDDSYCLMPDGRVMSAGYGNGAFLSGLSGVKRIFAGAYGTAAETDAGLQFSHPSLKLDAVDVTDLAIAPGVAICADAEGVTHCTYDRVPQWTDVCRVAAGENGVIALTKDGKVNGFLFGRHNVCSFDFDQPVIDIAAGPNHFAFLLADGTLEVRGTDGSVNRYDCR